MELTQQSGGFHALKLEKRWVVRGSEAVCKLERVGEFVTRSISTYPSQMVDHLD